MPKPIPALHPSTHIHNSAPGSIKFPHNFHNFVPGFQLVCTETALRPLPPCYTTSSPPLTEGPVQRSWSLQAAGVCVLRASPMYTMAKENWLYKGEGVSQSPSFSHVFSSFCTMFFCTYFCIAFSDIASSLTSHFPLLHQHMDQTNRHRDQQAICTLCFF